MYSQFSNTIFLRVYLVTNPGKTNTTTTMTRIEPTLDHILTN